MRVVQLLPSLVKGDAISNDAVCMDEVLRKEGYETRIYADYLGNGMSRETVSLVGDKPNIGEEDLLIYHLSTGSRLNALVKKLPCRKLFIYHNITPASFFAGCSPLMEQKAQKGLYEIRQLRDSADMVLAVSRYNREHLQSMGYTCPIEVLPILIPWEEYDREVDSDILQKYKDGYYNILFTGRIAPNKKQEDLIAAFCEFHRKYQPKSRLILVGNEAGMESYGRELRKYVSALGLRGQDVVFAGHISFQELLGFYRAADVFLSLSEHEGFCVPLVEAMHFSIPVVAFDAAAIGETLGGSGILLERKEPAYVARVLRELQANPSLRERIVEGQDKRLCDFEKDRIAEQFLMSIRCMTEGKYYG